MYTSDACPWLKNVACLSSLFAVLTTTQAYNGNSLILYIYLNGAF